MVARVASDGQAWVRADANGVEERGDDGAGCLVAWIVGVRCGSAGGGTCGCRRGARARRRRSWVPWRPGLSACVVDRTGFYVAGATYRPVLPDAAMEGTGVCVARATYTPVRSAQNTLSTAFVSPWKTARRQREASRHPTSSSARFFSLKRAVRGVRVRRGPAADSGDVPIPAPIRPPSHGCVSCHAWLLELPRMVA
jgi:hypothetical protein